MSRVLIMTDSNSGITQAQASELGIKVIPMPVYVNDETYFEEVNITQEGFYNFLEDSNNDIKTSLPSLDTLSSMWDEGLKECEEIIYIPMSSGLSSSCSSAVMLATEDEYEGKVYVVNNQRISVTQKQSVLDALALANKGFSAKEIHDILIREKFKSSIYIMVDTLTYLKKGGRITPTAAAIGSVLKIKPVLTIQGEKLDAYTKVKTLKQAKQAMIKGIKKDFADRFNDPSGNSFHIAVSYTKDDTEAKIFIEELKEEFPDREIHVDPLAFSISCHIGPGALAIAVSHKVDELQ